MTSARVLKATGKAVLDELLRELRTEKGVHLESAAVALGALAGFGCQVAVKLAIKDSGSYHGLSVVTATGANGDVYLFGDAINRPLYESPDSVWVQMSTAARELGAAVPDVEELFAYVAGTVGGDAFGIPRYAPETWSETPSSFLPLWGKFSWLFQGRMPASQWYLGYAAAFAGLLKMTGRDFDVEPLVRIGMESAIAMAKLALD